MANPQKSQQATTAAVETQEASLLDQIVTQGRFGAEPSQKERGKNLVKEFVAQVLEGSDRWQDNLLTFPEIPNLAVLPSGERPQHPAELLTGQKPFDDSAAEAARARSGGSVSDDTALEVMLTTRDLPLAVTARRSRTMASTWR